MTKEQKSFIEQIGASAQQMYEEVKILPSLVIAMAIKESNWGKSALASKNFNYFGMKWTTKCGTKYAEYNTKEWDKASGKYITVKAKFRSYANTAEGIKGFYDFITGYKRYSNLIGESDAFAACQKIQKDGWATAPDYAVSLYNNYIKAYDLTAYDTDQQVIVSEDPADDVKPYYIKGKVYTTKVNLYIRKTPGGVKKKPYELTVSGKMHSYCDPYGDAVLRAGTRVTCLDTVHDGKSVWILIPSGYICAVTSAGTVYIE